MNLSFLLLATKRKGAEGVTARRMIYRSTTQLHALRTSSQSFLPAENFDVLPTGIYPNDSP